MINAKQLAEIFRAEAGQIMATQRDMESRRQGLWLSRSTRTRLEAIGTANHQLTFSLLAIAEQLEKL